MTDPLARELADRVAAATPTTLPPFEEIRRRARRDRVRNMLVVAASAAVVAGVVIGSWSLRMPNPDGAPDHPMSSPSPSADSTPSRPDPTYSRSAYPSGLVIRTPERDIDLPADTSCWRKGADTCRLGLLEPGDPVPDVGPRGAIDFWFARPGWHFTAILRGAGEVCPRATTIDAARTDDQWFRLTPADQMGRYDVELFGEGPGCRVSARFVWTTTSDGPVDPPVGAVALYPDPLGEGSYSLEVTVDDLAFHPARSELSRSVEVRVTDADGQERTLAARLIPTSLECGSHRERGYFFYQQEWPEDFSPVRSDSL